MFMLRVIMPNVIMLNVIMLNVVMLSVIMPNAIMLSVIMLSVVALSKRDLSLEVKSDSTSTLIRDNLDQQFTIMKNALAYRKELATEGFERIHVANIIKLFWHNLCH
jgi:ABC-type transport system involved in cytochrome bd biosynthesis fused ATPase/permease subunit